MNTDFGERETEIRGQGETMKKLFKQNIICILIVFIALLVVSGNCGSPSKKELKNRILYYQKMQDDQNKLTVFTETSTIVDVVKWWKSSWIKGRTRGLNTVFYKLENLKALQKEKGYEAYTFIKSSDVKIVLEVPTETWIKGAEQKCTANTSRLYVLNLTKKSKININPHCSETYNLSEVDIALYWLPQNKFPLIAIGINGPACVPSYLYKYNKETTKYEKVAELCGG